MSNTLYPGAIDSPYDPTTSDTLATMVHHTQHGLANDAIVALETKLGTGSSSQTPNTGMYLVGTGSGATQWVSTLTSPSITTSLLDANNKTWIGQNAAGASAVNYPLVGNSVSGSAVTYGAAGTDSNVGVNLVPKGSGKVQDNGTSLVDFRSSFSNFIAAGTGVWTQNSGLIGSMTAATIWINGVEYSVAAVSNHTFGASVDTYIDYTVGTGITYTAVSNNAASPSLAANSVRIAIVVSGASAINSINQGAPTAAAPVVSSNILSVTDSLGNLIYPTANQKVIGYRQITSNINTSSASAADMVGLAPVVNIPTGAKVKLTFGCRYISFSATAGVGFEVSMVDATASAEVMHLSITSPGTNYACNANFSSPSIVPPAYGARTYKMQYTANGTNALTVNASSSSPVAPAFLRVEIE